MALKVLVKEDDTTVADGGCVVMALKCVTSKSTRREVNHHVHTMLVNEVKTSEGRRQTTVFSAPLCSCRLSSSHLKRSHAPWIMFFFTLVHQWSASTQLNRLARWSGSHVGRVLGMFAWWQHFQRARSNVRALGDILSDAPNQLDSFPTNLVLLVWMATLDVLPGWVGVSNQTAKPVCTREGECLMV